MAKYSYIEEIEKWKKEFSFFINIKIRLSETDLFGHMNNTSPFIYFEEARASYLTKFKSFNLENKTNPIPIVADLQCDYHRQVFFNEELRLYIKVKSIGNSSMDLNYMAVNEYENICFTGRGKLVMVDMNSGKATMLTENQKSELINEMNYYTINSNDKPIK